MSVDFQPTTLPIYPDLGPVSCEMAKAPHLQTVAGLYIYIYILAKHLAIYPLECVNTYLQIRIHTFLNILRVPVHVKMPVVRVVLGCWIRQVAITT